MKRINEVSRLTGVTERALRYYDSIGLLKPTAVTEAGYRLYDEAALERLQHILLFRELEFPLESIKQILDSPNFDRRKALEQQIELFKLKKEHFDRLISFATENLTGGKGVMDYSVFDKTKMEEYGKKAKEQWGNTAEFKEYEKKNGDISFDEKAKVAKRFMALFAELGGLKTEAPDSCEVQSKIAGLQKFISDNYYTCSKEILSSLGQMYAAGGEFTENIDRAGGTGTAKFVSEAIEIYCK